MKIMSAIIFVGMAVLIPCAQANIGDTLREAEAHGKTYETHYGAILPLFETDSDGKVIWECWAAPAEQWTKDQAFRLAQQLIPAKTATQTPKNEGVDGTLERFTYPDGTVIILQVFQGRYMGVEVHSSSYVGNYC